MSRRLWVAVLAASLASCAADGLFWRGPSADAYDWSSDVIEAGRVEERTVVVDGARLAAFWLPPVDDAAPVVLYFHGAGANLQDAWRWAEAFDELGFGVFAIDYRGFGRSEGSASEGRSYEDGDAAWAALAELGVTADRVVVYGHSLGGAVASHVALAHPDAHALVLDSTLASAERAFESALGLESDGGFVVDGEWDNEGRLRRMGPIPKLLLHSRADRVFPVWNAERNFAAATEPKTLVVVSGAAHGAIPFEATAAWRAALCCHVLSSTDAATRCGLSCE